MEKKNTDEKRRQQQQTEDDEPSSHRMYDSKGPTLLSFNKDQYLVKNLLKLVNAYQLLKEDTDRTKYLETIRLRSLASQYLSMVPILKDGHFFPYIIFSVIDRDRKSDLEFRMLELDFVDDVMHDRFKDHVSRSFHFSMIKRVNKCFASDEFYIEFNDGKCTYAATVPFQRDFIVAMIRTAMEESQLTMDITSGVNCPVNHNLVPIEDIT